MSIKLCSQLNENKLTRAPQTSKRYDENVMSNTIESISRFINICSSNKYDVCPEWSYICFVWSAAKWPNMRTFNRTYNEDTIWTIRSPLSWAIWVHLSFQRSCVLKSVDGSIDNWVTYIRTGSVLKWLSLTT